MFFLPTPARGRLLPLLLIVGLCGSARADKPVWAGQGGSGNGNASNSGNWTNTTTGPGHSSVVKVDKGSVVFDVVDLGGLEFTTGLDLNNQVTTGTITGSTTVTFSSNVDPSKWDAGEINFSAGGFVFDTGVTLTIGTGNSHKLTGGTITTKGSTNWSGGAIDTSSGTALNNNSGATFTNNFDGTISGSGTFSNAGTFEKNGGGGGQTNVQTRFDNTGTLKATSGKLKLSGGGSSSGGVTIGSGAKLEIATNNYSFTGGTLASASDGAIDVTSAIASFSGTSGSANLNVAGGTATFNGNHNGTGKLSLSAGTVNGSGTGTFNALDWSGGTINGKVAATGSAATLSGGAKTIDTNGDLTLSGSASGTSAWSGQITNKGKFTHAGGLAEIQSSFVNDGGTLTASSGNLKLLGGGSSNGTIALGSGAEIDVGSIDFAVSGGAINGTAGKLKLLDHTTTFSNSTSGDAELAVAGGTAIFNGTHSGSGKLSLSNGTVNGSGGATFSALDWSGGTINGKITATSTAATISGGAKTIDTAGDLTLTGATSGTSAWGGAITNKGKLTHSGGSADLQSSFANDGGTLTASSGKLKLSGGGSSSGTIALGSGAEIEVAGNDFSVGGGSINGPSGKFKLTDHTTTFSNSTSGDAELAVAGGTAAFNGTHNGSGKLSLSNGTVNGSGSATFSALDWSGGTINGKVTATSNAATIGGGAKTIDTAGDLTLTGSSSGTSAWSGAITNKGKFTHAGGSAEILSSFANDGGTLAASSGTLKLSGGGSSSGTISLGSSAEIDVGSTDFSVNGGAVNGATGKFKVLDHTTTFSNSTSGDAELAVAGGTATFNGTHSGSGKLSLSNGTVNGSGSATFSALDWSGGTINGKITATGNAANVSGGAKTIDASGDLTVAGSATATANTWTGNLTNSGKLTHSGGTTDVQGHFSNAGTLTASAGKLKLSGGGSSDGTIALGSGAEVEIATNDFSISGAITGASGKLKLTDDATTTFGNSSSQAEIVVAGGTANFSGQHNGTGKLTVSSGTVTGSGAATFNSLDWSGGTLNGKVTATGAAANVSGNAKTIDANGDLTVAGSATATANTWTGTVTNNGKLTHASGSTDIQSNFTNAGTLTAGSGKLKLSGGGSSSGNIALGNGAEIEVGGNDFSVGGGTINGAAGKFKLTDHTTTFSNSTSGDAEIAVTGGTATFNGSHVGNGKLSLSTGTVNGTGSAEVGSFVWTGGTLGGKVKSNGATTLSNGSKNISGELTLNGDTTWDGSQINSSGTAKIKNQAGKTFSANADGLMAAVDSATFTNDGIFEKTSGLSNGSTEIHAKFDSSNGAEIKATGGNLKFTGGGSSKGNVTIGNGAKLQIDTGDYTFDGGMLNSAGSGALELLGGITTFSGTTNGNANLVLKNTGNARFSGTHTTSGSLAFSAGTIDGAGSAEVGSFDWSGGTLKGKVKSNGATTIGTSQTSIDGGELTLAGTTTWDGTQINASHSAKIKNSNGNFFNANADGLLADSGGSVFSNEGTFQKTGGTGNGTEIHALFENKGTVNANSGKLRLTGGASNALGGVFNVGDNAELELSGNVSFASGSQLKGNGLARLLNGVLDANGTIDIANFEFNGGQLNGSHTFKGIVTWNGGDWSSATAATTTIGSSATLKLNNGNGHDLAHRAIQNDGTIEWHGGDIRAGTGGSLLNGNAFNDDSNSNHKITDSTASFTNNGTYHKTGNGVTSVEVAFTNNNAINVGNGTLWFTQGFTQSAGTLTVASGAIARFDNGLNFAAGQLGGNGTIVGNVTNSAVIAPGASPGLLTITGNLVFTSDGQLSIQLGGTSPGTTYDVLAVGGAATLGGTLSLSFINDFQNSVTALNTFTILTASSITGAFTNVANGGRLDISGGIGSFQVNYGLGNALTNAVVLSNFSAVPEPSTWVLMLSGLAASACALRRRKRR